jgi:hypothetical protein
MSRGHAVETAPARNRVHPSIRLSRYRSHLELARTEGFEFVGFDGVSKSDRFIILRHDVDLDLDCARTMAHLETEIGAASTFFIMLHNDLYNPFGARSRGVIRELVELGHTVGLHFDPTFWAVDAQEEIAERIRLELDLLSEICGRRVFFVSFHQPLPFFLEDDFGSSSFESVYNERFTAKGGIRYIADSMGTWREESIDELIRSGRSPKIHFLAHPALWVHEEGELLNERLRGVAERRRRRVDDEIALAVNDPRRELILYDKDWV